MQTSLVDRSFTTVVFYGSVSQVCVHEHRLFQCTSPYDIPTLYSSRNDGDLQPAVASSVAGQVAKA